MSNKRFAILELFPQGKRQSEIVPLFNVSQQTVSKAIKCFGELGHEGVRSGRGRKTTVNTPEFRKIIKIRVDQNPTLSRWKVARELELNHESVRHISKNELMLKPYKLRKAQYLTNQNKLVKLQKSRRLFSRAVTSNWKRIFFTDEKLFTIEQYNKRLNDRIVVHHQHLQSKMDGAGIYASSQTPLIFIDERVKINKDECRWDILEAVLRPWAQQHFVN